MARDCQAVCASDLRTVHRCCEYPRQWCPHLGWHLRIALGPVEERQAG
jgi:hypothetical protein